MADGTNTSDERRGSRATVLKLAAAGVAGAVGASALSPPEAQAGEDNSFLARNDTTIVTLDAFVTQVGNQGKGYIYGAYLRGTNGGVDAGGDTYFGVSGTSSGGNGVRAFSQSGTAGNTGAGLWAEGQTSGGDGIYALAHGGGGRAIYAENTAAGDAVHAVEDGAGNAVFGTAASGNGVHGVSGNVNGYGVQGENTGGGTGVYGSTSSNGRVGVWGQNSGSAGSAPGVQGDGITGVVGNGSVTGVAGVSAGDGVVGTANGTGAGVHGVGHGGSAVRAEDKSSGITANGLLATSSAGTAVNASTNSGTAVTAEVQGPGGIALYVQGRAVYSNCGVATIAGAPGATKLSVTVKGAALSANSIVLATLQANVSGVFVASAVPHVGAKTITINLNKAVAQNVKVGWFVCDLIPTGPA